MDMMIVNADVLVTSDTKIKGVQLINCNITCNFKIFNDDYVAPKTFEVRGLFDDKTEEYKRVFENVTVMMGCTIKESKGD